MHIKDEKGIAGIDIAASVIIITIFIAMIASLIVNINYNSKDVERKGIATSYAVREIESIKSKGYTSEYNDKGVTEEYIIEEDIYENGIFSGYHKKTSIKDYILIKQDSSKQKNLVKEITVEISYKVGNKNKNVSISTYIAVGD